MSAETNDPQHQKFLVALHHQITRDYDEGELEQLCFNLGFDDEEIKGETKSDKVRELIQYFERRQELDKLIQRCAIERPKSDWTFAQDISRPSKATVSPATLLSQPTFSPSIFKRFTRKQVMTVSAVSLAGLITAIAALISSLNPFIGRIWPQPQPADTPVPTIQAIIPTVAPSATPVPVSSPTAERNPELFLEQFHNPIVTDRDMPSSSILRVPLKPATRGRVEPRRTGDSVWLLACQLDAVSTNTQCRAKSLIVAGNGRWSEVADIFDPPDICHDFEVRIWVVDQSVSTNLRLLVSSHFARSTVSSFTPEALDTLKVRVDLDKNDQEIDCSVAMANQPKAMVSHQER